MEKKNDNRFEILKIVEKQTQEDINSLKKPQNIQTFKCQHLPKKNPNKTEFMKRHPLTDMD